MNTTINLVERLLATGRSLHKMGVSHKALHLLNSLSGFRSLPEPVARETRLRLARLLCQRRNYRRARRLLTGAAVAEQPRDLFLLAKAAAADVRCDPKIALRCYRKCLNLDPHNPRYLTSFGWFAFRNGREKLALRTLRQAFQLAPTNAGVVRRYLRVLQDLHRIGEARQVLRQCRFRSGNEVWFQNLLSDFEFYVLHLRQRKQRRSRVVKSKLLLLPFPPARLQNPSQDDTETVRRDGPTVLPAPHLPLPLRRPNQRHAQ